ncbi:MAG: metallo-beta-lactamase class [Betaproteobacteria bacterium]|nr:metallo-beta-lactamase class [Betaproteobacteria bacterium]
MPFRLIPFLGIVLGFVTVAGHAYAQQPAPKPAQQNPVEAAQQTAKDAAEFEFLGALARTCLLPPSRSEDLRDIPAPYVSDPNKAPPRATWYAEPAKVFDNLYFVGGKIHSSWALKTREGIILLDTIYPYNSEELIVGGMRKLGLDPKDIKYVVISHAHQDHIGGAEMLQKRYGARVVMSGPDWDLVEKVPNRFKSMAPKRDIVATDGMKLTLGESTVNIWFTPGHTDGTISFTFQVLDRGRPVNLVYSGGTALVYEYHLPEWSIKNLNTYIVSQRHLAAKAKETGATVLISNHSEFDNAYNKNRMLAGRGNGPHPYEIGADWVQRYFKVTENCARATQLKVEQQAAQSR